MRAHADRAVVAIIIVAAVLRLAGVFDDFWMDEIWSYRIAQQLRGPADVLLSPEARIDNNHPLNTLWMWLIGDRRNWWIYRLPALAAGIGSVVLAAKIMLRRGRGEALLAAALLGTSYPLVFFSSEARGYALAVFFALLGFDALERYLARPRWRLGAIFAGACVLGLLSHLTFVHFYLGALAWSAWRMRRDLVRLAALHAIPLLWLGFIYLVFVAHLMIGGSPPQQFWKALVQSMAELVGAPGPAALEIVAAAILAAAVVALSLALRRRGSDLWIFLLVTAVIAPALTLLRQGLLQMPHQPIAARYFLVPFAFLLLMAALILPGLRRPRIAATAVRVLLVLFLAGNLYQTIRFLWVGRGHYSDAVAYMAEETRGPAIIVLADQPYRTGMVLDFYRRILPPRRMLVIYDGMEDPPGPRRFGPPMWIILHNNLHHRPPEQSIPGPAPGITYVLDRDFDYYGLSGYSWYLYRLKPAATPAGGSHQASG